MSFILTNSEKTRAIQNPSSYDFDILKANKLDYLVSSYNFSEMPSKDDLVNRYRDKLESRIKNENIDSEDSEDSDDDISGEEITYYDSFPQTNKKIDKTIELFIEADPTPNRKYVEWLIKSYIRGGISRLEDLGSRAKPALQNFIILSRKKKLNKGDKPWENEYDINNYFGLKSGEEKGRIKLGLEDVMEKYEEFLEKKKVQDISKKEYELYFENDKVKVYHPLTEAASCKIGAATRWCTAGDEKNRFEEYNKKGPLYIIVPKDRRYEKEKYQFQHESEMYMDDQDEPVDPVELFERYDMLDEINKIDIYETNSIDRLIYVGSKYPNLKLSFINKEVMDDYNYFYDHEDNSVIISNEELDKLKDFKGNLIKIEIINGGLESLPESIGNLSSLQTLYLSDNELTSLPESIGNLSSLQELDLSNNELKELPESIGNLISLKRLDLSNNELTSLPESIGNLSSLQELDLSINELTSLPESIGKLSNLRSLYFNNNDNLDISTVPERFR